MKAILILAAALGMLGCNESVASGCGDTDSDADTDTDSDTDTDTDSDIDTDSDVPVCPDPIAETCPEAVDPLPQIFSASDLGEGTVFVDVAPWSVLAERDAGTTRTISIIACAPWGDGPCTAANAAVASLDVPVDSGLHAVAVAKEPYENNTGLPSHVAVLCDLDACALYGAEFNLDIPDTEIAAIPGGEITETTIVHGLWWDGDSGPVCAYGDGIHCFDGTQWDSPIPANAEYPLLNDMETTNLPDQPGPGAVAVGDSGRIAYSGFPSWDEYGGPAYPDWYTVCAGRFSLEQPLVLAGEDGALKVYPGGYDECTVGDEDILALEVLLYSGEDTSWTTVVGATASGRVFTGEGPVSAMEGLCYTGQVVGASPKAVTFSCGIENNIFFMDETAVHGTTDCGED
jgi:hypothetical protein